MAVAVKTPPGAQTGGAIRSIASSSLLGVAYLIVCLVVVFKVIPSLWWGGFSALGVSTTWTVEATALLVVVCLSAVVFAALYASRLLGPEPRPGVRGGVFVGFLFLLVVLLLARWASMWVEYYVAAGSLNYVGGVITAVLITGALVYGAIRLFLTKRVQNAAAWIESGGWFDTHSYKPSQGRVVRRATIIGILLLIIAGIWTMLSHGTLRRAPNDLVLNIPFSSNVAVTQLRDMGPFVAKALKDAGETPTIEIRTKGASTAFLPGDHVTEAQFRAEVEKIARENNLDGALEAARQKVAGVDGDDKDLATFLLAVNQVISDRMWVVLSSEGKSLIFESKNTLRALNEAYNNSTYSDLQPAILVFDREATGKKKDLGPQFKLPTGVLVLSPVVLRLLNEQADPKNQVRVGLSTSPFALGYGKVVSAAEFDAAEKKAYIELADRRLSAALRGSQASTAKDILEALGKSKNGQEFKSTLDGFASTEVGQLGADLKELKSEAEKLPLPPRETLQTAYGNEEFASIPLLPSVRFTLPILMLAVAVWFAWRVVNMPAFADFLISTEAEMNKVSWTTQKRLVQDTIVVLATLFLMSVFLFAMDYTWKILLSWDKIGVLYIPKETEDTKSSDKKW